MTIRELREGANLRQEDVARELDVDQSAVSHWENGKAIPSKKYRKKLAELYNCDVDDIVRS